MTTEVQAAADGLAVKDNFSIQLNNFLKHNHLALVDKRDAERLKAIRQVLSQDWIREGQSA